MSIQRSQIRLNAVTGSLVDISNVANSALSPVARLNNSPAADVQIDTLEGILGQVGAAIKRIQGDSSKDFTDVSAGVFTHELSRFTGDVALTGSVLISGADSEIIDKVSGGSLKLRAGALTGSVGKVSIELSGSEVMFRDGFTEAGGWSDDLSLAQSATDWQRFKTIFGEVSILSAISTAAALPTDSKFLHKVTSQTTSITGGQLRQVDGTHFSGSFIAVPTGSRNENVDLFLNGQLLVSKSYDAIDYDYDIAGDGSTITFNFQLQPDDFLTAYAPISVASVAAYIGSNGIGGAGGGGTGGSGATDLDGLTDVAITSPTMNQVLKYNGSQWVNSASPAGATDLDGLTDVAVTSPSNGQVLKYNGTSWVNDSPAAVPTDLDSLTDVVITSAASEQVLKFNGTSWVNASAPLTPSGSLDGLTDVAISTPSLNQSVKYNGTGWVNSSTSYDVGGAVAGRPTISEIVMRSTFARAGAVTGGYAYCETAPTSTTTLTIQKGVNSSGTISYSNVGSISFNAGETVGTVTITGTTETFSAGNVIRVVAAASQDLTFASPTFSFIAVEA